MPLDLYSSCPCGSGKKLKFCCADLLPDLEAELGMIDADQNQACLQHNAKAEERHPGRAALAVLRITALLRSSQLDLARVEVQKFRANHPTNPTALVFSAMIKAVDGDPVSAIGDLQSALEIPEVALPYETVEACIRIAEMLLQGGHPMGARGHATVAAALDRESKEINSLLAQVIRSGQLALPQRDDYIWFKPKEEGTPFATEYESILKFAKGGQWRKAAPMLEALGERFPKSRETWQALAYCRAFLADEVGAAAAWRKIVANPPSQADAVDAEAQAQLLDRDADSVEIVDFRYNVKDMDKLVELITSDKHAVPFPVDPEPWAAQGEPPPQAAFDWLDRPRPAAGDTVTAENSPIVMVSLSLFGKRTDREASLSIQGTRTPGDDAARKAVLALAGDTVSGEPTEEVLGLMSREVEAVSPQPWFPPVNPEEARKLVKAIRARAIRETWPELPLAKFGGRSARQAAADSPVPVLAAIALLEYRDEDEPSGVDFDALRSSLGLPAVPVPAADITVPLSQLVKTDVKQFNDNDLLLAFQRAGSAMARGFLKKVILELLARPHFREEGAASLYRQLIAISTDSDERLATLEEARKVPNQKEVELAMWDLQELEIRLIRAEVNEFQRLAAHITSKYSHLPEVRRAFTQLLMQFGLIGEDGRPTRPRGAAPMGEPAAAPAAAGPGVWTPGADVAKPAAGAKKSGLWVPGMD